MPYKLRKKGTTLRKVLAAFILCSAFIILFASCNQEKSVLTTVTADIVMIRANKDQTVYDIYFDGYPPENWWWRNIVIKIDSSINKPRAMFYINNGRPADKRKIELVFRSREDLENALKVPAKIFLKDSNSNTVVQTENNNSSCFIATLYQGI